MSFIILMLLFKTSFVRKNWTLLDVLNKSFFSKSHLNISLLKLLNIDTNIFIEFVKTSSLYTKFFGYFLYNFFTSIVKFFFSDKIKVKSFCILFSFVFSVSMFALLSFIIILFDSEEILGYSMHTFCSLVNG